MGSYSTVDKVVKVIVADGVDGRARIRQVSGECRKCPRGDVDPDKVVASLDKVAKVVARECWVWREDRCRP